MKSFGHSRVEIGAIVQRVVESAFDATYTSKINTQFRRTFQNVNSLSCVVKASLIFQSQSTELFDANVSAFHRRIF